MLDDYVWSATAAVLGIVAGSISYWIVDRVIGGARRKRAADTASYIEARQARMEDRVDARFPRQAAAIKWLLGSAVGHKRRLSRSGERAFRFLQAYQIALVVLGLISTLILGLTDTHKGVAIIPTALSTAISALAGFYDLQGSAARHYSALALVSQIESEIEFRVFVANPEAAATNDVGQEELDKWLRRMDAAVTKHNDGFVKTVVGQGKK